MEAIRIHPTPTFSGCGGGDGVLLAGTGSDGVVLPVAVG